MRRRTRRAAVPARDYAIAAGLALAVLVLLWAVWGIAHKESIARRAVEARKAELAELTARKAVFEANLAELESDRGREGTLRQNHGVAMAGEEVIIVVPPEEPLKRPERRWYDGLLRFFGVR